jgi:predicted PurR-regulated permease PerM
MTNGQTPAWLRRTVLASLLGALLLVGFVVMRPFLAVIAWAARTMFVPREVKYVQRVDCR